MTIPAYLDSTVYPFNSTTVLGLADVETGGVGIISSMRALLVGTALNWTEPSTALFKTPVDASGRFLDVLVTRISSTVIEWRVRNQAATTVCTRRFNLGTGALFIHGSSMGVYAEFVQTAQNAAQNASAFVLDVAPDLISDTTLYVVGSGFLTTAGGNDGASDQACEFFAIDNGTATTRNRTIWTGDDQVNGGFLTAAGKYLFMEAPISINFAGTLKWAGRIPHMLLCSTDFNGGDERDIYIDSNTVARFRTISSTATPATNARAMVRKS